MVEVVLVKVGIIGVGNIGEALLRGVLRARVFSPEDLLISDIDVAKVEKIKNELGVVVCRSNDELASRADVIVIAVKPHDVANVLRDIAAAAEGKTIISVAAGVSTASIEAALKGGGVETPRVVRVMPNIACVVGAAASVVCKGAYADERDENVAKQIFGAVGSVLTADEKDMDVITGLSGSGIAFLAIAIEALADGAVHEGLPRSIAVRLAAQVAEGAAKMIISGKRPAEVKELITSPGGTTIAGIRALEEKCVRAAFMDAVIEATRRAKEIARLLETLLPSKGQEEV